MQCGAGREDGYWEAGLRGDVGARASERWLGWLQPRGSSSSAALRTRPPPLPLEILEKALEFIKSCGRLT